MLPPASKVYLCALALYLCTWVATAGNLPLKFGRGWSSVFFPISGNVYPKGYFHVTLSVGQPPNDYFLDIDTGSDLTWIQCDGPCLQSTPAPHDLYKPKGNQISRMDPICAYVQRPCVSNCLPPPEQCHYVIEYSDNGSSTGVLVKDSVPLKLTNRAIVAPQLVFGCGYNQTVENPTYQTYTDGVLGLGPGKSSILTQLRSMGVTRSVVGHCLSGQGGGYLFFGDSFIPSSGIIVWKPMRRLAEHYSLGPLDVHFGGRANTNINGLHVIFDTGSTYTYFNSRAYTTLLSLIRRDLVGKGLRSTKEDDALPVCWKGAKPFRSVHDASSYFKPLALSFTDNVQFQIPAESYTIVTRRGNLCLGILNGTEAGLGEDLNLIGGRMKYPKYLFAGQTSYIRERAAANWMGLNKLQ